MSHIRPVTLAIEGGGVLGAFAWGMIDRLLDEKRLRIEAVSGTSAGAMNAAMLVQGLASGGRDEARRLLETFWRRVAVTAGSLDVLGTQWLPPLSLPLGPMMDVLRHTATAWPQMQAARLGHNALRGVLEGLLDSDVFGGPGAPLLVVAATKVRTGEVRLFRDREVTEEALLASSCLPLLFPTVEIDGEAYWDGGYASNPPLRALIEAGTPPDVIILRNTPVEREDVPISAGGILERVGELAFGTALRQELRSLAVAQRLLSDIDVPDGPLARLRDARLHMIGADSAALPGRRDPSWGVLSELRDRGQAAAAEWLGQNFADIGTRATVDLDAFAGPALDISAAEEIAPSSA